MQYLHAAKEYFFGFFSFTGLFYGRAFRAVKKKVVVS